MKIALKNELEKLLTVGQFEKLDSHWVLLYQGPNAPLYSVFEGVVISFKFRKNRIHVVLYATNEFSKQHAFKEAIDHIRTVRSLYTSGIEKDKYNSTRKIFDTIFSKPSDAASFAQDLAVRFTLSGIRMWTE
ncbi:hypothetical protein LRP52_45090 [Photobacterium sp. ZSDE20]|uniref:Uncharacterized protein n=1 Tax=Photobacterium pectinilyticum TaxID=2906793 RepID=A0ABT1N9C9_9GAMM|nr:hypothetical protein [Photobacterium sp. ZSDE20]MCQ1061157.1 hypothetical protein [Photobacterium sp. ZSDE20]MDD1829343.1 hypothetical protein [Photobacterium sp. ZSDE20]